MLVSGFKGESRECGYGVEGFCFCKKNHRESERVINRVLGSSLSIASDFEEL